MLIATIIGARPQFIKASAVSRALSKLPRVREIIIHTGQHYDRKMSDIFFAELEIPKPDYHLGIGSGHHGAQTGKMMGALEKVLIERKPDLVLVYGDTNSTLAGALAAVKLHLPVAHIEAGLRSFNRRMPEEINRVLTDHSSDILFAPTAGAVKNLLREGIAKNRIIATGDVMYDVARYFGTKANGRSAILRELGLTSQQYILATIHRAENTDNAKNLKNICSVLSRVARHLPVVLPLHPRTKIRLARYGLEPRGLSIIGPVGYLDMTVLERNAALIATDSGGVQKEAFFHKVPCATLRRETEWTELVNAGWNTLIDCKKIRTASERILNSIQSPGKTCAPYGDGAAAQKIAAALMARFRPRN